MVGGDSGSQVVEDTAERLADIAVEKIESLGCV